QAVSRITYVNCLGMERRLMYRYGHQISAILSSINWPIAIMMRYWTGPIFHTWRVIIQHWSILPRSSLRWGPEAALVWCIAVLAWVLSAWMSTASINL